MNMKIQSLLTTVFMILVPILANTFLHNPLGSNDRNQEANTNRNNANRLFDSQNNAKGGYCRGPTMSYYAGSLLDIQWTSMHLCGDSKSSMRCNFVLQLMCSRSNAPLLQQVRDGTSTNTIPDVLATAADATFGLHEPYEYYQMCKGRDRNFGLFIADRETVGGLNAGRRSAIFTRENNNGNRFGFECAEERDYYPYWGPSPWIDIAVFVDDLSYCSVYRNESQNVKARGYCQKPVNDITNNQEVGPYARHITQTACTAAGYSWINVPAWGVGAPQCLSISSARIGSDDPITTSLTGPEYQFTWTVPASVPTNWSLPNTSDCVASNNCNCVMRLRWNSTNTVDAAANYNAPFPTLDSSDNGANSPITNEPRVVVAGLELDTAAKSDQVGRSHQDRTHMFKIMPKPAFVTGATRILNLNVKGKRGNVIQAYPAQQYDFVPQYLEAVVGDYIHFQWTGCDQNPAGNAGEGTDQTDRSNIVQIKQFADIYPADDFWLDQQPSNRLLFPLSATRELFAYVGQIPANCVLNPISDADPNNCFKLNQAPQYFDAGLVRMNNTGEFFYMSTRNNNFSNRHQKGAIRVTN